MNSETGQQLRRERPAFKTTDWTNQKAACPACGSIARRSSARFCATCGRALEGGYFPADTLRASYHRRYQSLAYDASRAERARAASPMLKKFPMENRNGASTTALAFVTYALVPYLGILFCPGALLMGSIGLVRSIRTPHAGGRRASYAGIILGLLLLCLQLFLWWLLYKVPQWTGMP
jgi:hypothetical protein